MKYIAYSPHESDIVSLPINACRYEEVSSARSTCLFAVEVEEKFALLLDNFFEFETELLVQAQREAIWPHRDHEQSMLGRLTIDRRLVNVLTACFLFKHQISHGVSRFYGNPSKEFDSLEQFVRDLYDNHWGYRLMEALRNHGQHHGLIVHVITYRKARINGELDDYEQHQVIPQTKPEKLAENGRFKPAVLSELVKKHGENVDLRLPVREYITCFIALHNEIQSLICPKLTKARSIYEAAISEYSNIDGHEVKFPSISELNVDGSKGKKVALISDFLGYYDSLRERNRVNPRLVHSCANNSVKEKTGRRI